MSSEFDEVAKAVAKNMPRRRILKLFAGGVAAAIGTAIAGSATSAQPFQGVGFFSFICEPSVNDTVGTQGAVVMSGEFPYYLPGFQGSPNYAPDNKECMIGMNGSQGMWNLFGNTDGF